MKKTIRGLVASIALLIFGAAPAGAVVTSLDDISFWVGSGSNRAGLVIDFHSVETKTSFAWGFLWDTGTPSGADMLIAIDNADANLSLTYSGDGESNFFLSGMDYVDGSTLYSGVADYGVAGVSWGYYLSGGSAYDFNTSQTVAIPGGGTSLPSSWTVSPSGASNSLASPGRSLADLSWDAWSFGAYNPVTFDHEVPPSSTVYAAVPEPTTFVLLGFAGGLIIYVRKRFHAC